MYQAVFQRYETKYLLSDAQYAAILDALSGRMALDHYGHTLIENIYLDTPDFRLIRRSLEKPEYKEKLRLRHYGGTPEEATFVEIKKSTAGLFPSAGCSFPATPPLLGSAATAPRRRIRRLPAKSPTAAIAIARSFPPCCFPMDATRTATQTAAICASPLTRGHYFAKRISPSAFRPAARSFCRPA